MDLHQKREQFQYLYPSLFDDLYRYVVYRVPHREEAEDIVATTLLRSFEHLDQFEHAKGTMIQWVFGIAKRRIIDYWRAKKIILNFEEALTLIETSSALPDATSDKLEFERIMQSLPPDVHALFALHYIDGLSYAEIAQITQRTPEAVRQFFSRTHRKLRLQFASLSL